MEHKNLMEYLKNLVQLEKAKYTEERTVASLQRQIESLGYYNNYQKPNPPAQYYDNSFSVGEGIEFTVGGAFIGAFIGWILGNIALGAAIVGVGVMMFIIIGQAVSSNRVNKERWQNYEQALEIYEQNVASDKQRVEWELREKQRLQELLQLMIVQFKKTQDTLERFYDKNIIYPKYRNMISICSIYEYFLSGICESLTGHEGAYSILENEIRFRVISTKLDEIITKLDEIKTNQSILYEAIEDGNRKTDELFRASIQQTAQLDFIAEKTAVAAYSQQQTANEANQIKWLMLWDRV